MRGPKFSILMPVKDAEATLSDAIKSIQNQSLENWEMILVNDHSSDRSSTIMSQAALSDSRIRVITNPGKGIVDALNTGLSDVVSPWVVRMDSDDLSLPLRLEKTHTWITNYPHTKVFSCLVKAFPSVTDGMSTYLNWLNAQVTPEEISRDMFVESPIAHPSAIVSTHVLRDCGGYRDGDFPEDYDLWLRLHHLGCEFRKVPEVLFHWRESTQRLSRTDERYRLDAFRWLKASHLVAGILSHNRQVQIWGAGPDGKKWAKLLRSFNIHVHRFFDIDPRKIGGRVGGEIPVLSWQELHNHRENTITLGAVGAKGARLKIREALPEIGLTETQNFVFVQ